jgi:hypothetical protein
MMSKPRMMTDALTHASWPLRRFRCSLVASDPIVIPVEVMRVGIAHANRARDSHVSQVIAVQIGRRWRNAGIGVVRVAGDRRSERLRFRRRGGASERAANCPAQEGQGHDCSDSKRRKKDGVFNCGLAGLASPAVELGSDFLHAALVKLPAFARLQPGLFRRGQAEVPQGGTVEPTRRVSCRRALAVPKNVPLRACFRVAS